MLWKSLASGLLHLGKFKIFNRFVPVISTTVYNHTVSLLVNRPNVYLTLSTAQQFRLNIHKTRSWLFCSLSCLINFELAWIQFFIPDTRLVILLLPYDLRISVLRKSFVMFKVQLSPSVDIWDVRISRTVINWSSLWWGFGRWWKSLDQLTLQLLSYPSLRDFSDRSRSTPPLRVKFSSSVGQISVTPAVLLRFSAVSIWILSEGAHKLALMVRFARLLFDKASLVLIDHLVTSRATELIVVHFVGTHARFVIKSLLRWGKIGKGSRFKVRFRWGMHWTETSIVQRYIGVSAGAIHIVASSVSKISQRIHLSLSYK